MRFLEDPVRMLRAVVLAARLEFTIDDASLDAIDQHKHEIARSAAPRSTPCGRTKPASVPWPAICRAWYFR